MRAFSSCNKQGLLSSCSAQASHCSDFLCCGAWVPGAEASVAVAQGLSCSKECGIFLDQGLNPCPRHWQVDSYPLSHQGSPIGATSDVPRRQGGSPKRGRKTLMSSAETGDVLMPERGSHAKETLVSMTPNFELV